jgi:hypothetical protein
MYDGIVLPMLPHGSDVWMTSAEDRTQMRVMEMKCMRTMCGVIIMDRVRKKELISNMREWACRIVTWRRVIHSKHMGDAGIPLTLRKFSG